MMARWLRRLLRRPQIDLSERGAAMLLDLMMDHAEMRGPWPEEKR